MKEIFKRLFASLGAVAICILFEGFIYLACKELFDGKEGSLLFIVLMSGISCFITVWAIVMFWTEEIK